MSIWVSVYCRKRFGRIKPSDLVKAIKERSVDFSDLNAQEAPEDTLLRLRVEEYKQTSSLPLLHLHYLEDGPPIVIDRVTNQEEVKEYIQEYLEEFFPGRNGKQANLVRRHLAEVVEILNFCLKQRHADGMGTPLTYAAAAWFADAGDGLIRVDEQGWMQLINGREFILIVPD
ncbi:MAG TPA: hypothetical protein VN688_11220 [Gemmataceae bacterium]|nr:hypothetical protein [Gemmataceae bacterium]